MTIDQIIDLESSLLNAIRTSDIHALENLLHDDLLFTAPDGQVVTKAMDLASHRAGTMVVEELTSSVEQINIIGDTAIAIVVYDTKGKMLGNPIQGRFRYIRFWKATDHRWKVIGGSCCKISD